VQAGLGVDERRCALGCKHTAPVSPDPLYAAGGTGSTGISSGGSSTRKKSGALQLKVHRKWTHFCVFSHKSLSGIYLCRLI
jgi:hypothetical protein